MFIYLASVAILAEYPMSANRMGCPPKKVEKTKTSAPKKGADVPGKPLVARGSGGVVLIMSPPGHPGNRVPTWTQNGSIGLFKLNKA